MPQKSNDIVYCICVFTNFIARVRSSRTSGGTLPLYKQEMCQTICQIQYEVAYGACEILFFLHSIVARNFNQAAVFELSLVKY